MQVTNEWIIQRFTRLARHGKDADVYEPWSGNTNGMTKEEASGAVERTLGEDERGLTCEDRLLPALNL